jgi:transcriptional regulator with XRE-family HTH domain
MAAERARASDVFLMRLRETRKARGLSQAELAALMTKAGRPMSRAALLRIENGERGISLDEALAFAAVLHVAPAHLLSPRGDGMVWPTSKVGFDGEGLRAWLLHGDKFIATASDYHRGEHAKTLERVVLTHAKALMDAQNGDDKAGVRAELAALGAAAGNYRAALETRGFELGEEE